MLSQAYRSLFCHLIELHALGRHRGVGGEQVYRDAPFHLMLVTAFIFTRAWLAPAPRRCH